MVLWFIFAPMTTSYQTTLKLLDKTTLGITTFPSKNTNTPTLILYPAFGVKATYYTKFAEQLSQKGITIVTADLRGHGLSSVRPNKENNYGFLAMITDLKAVADYLKKENPISSIYILGHSLGGQAASLAVAKYPSHFAGLIMVGSPNVYYKNWSGIHYYRRKILVSLLPVFGKLLTWLPKLKIGGYYTTPTQAEEWGYTGKTGNYKVIGDHFDYEAVFKKIKLPILAIFIEGDGMAPKKAVTNLSGKFVHAEVTNKMLTHKMAGRQVSHINWPRTAIEVVGEMIVEWVGLEVD